MNFLCPSQLSAIEKDSSGKFGKKMINMYFIVILDIFEYICEKTHMIGCKMIFSLHFVAWLCIYTCTIDGGGLLRYDSFQIKVHVVCINK